MPLSCSHPFPHTTPREEPPMVTTMRSQSHPKPCKVCLHPERAGIDSSLAVGQAPRSIARRYSDLTRRVIARHRDECQAKPARAA